MLQVLRYLVAHRRGLGAGAGRVHERECAVETDLLDRPKRFVEVRVGLAREADDEVGREGEIRDGGAQLADQTHVALEIVRSAHGLQDA